MTEEKNSDEPNLDSVEEQMEKDSNTEQEESSTKVSKLVGGIVLLSILFLGSYVFFVDTEPTTTTYNDYIFEKKAENVYETTVLTGQGDTVFQFRNHPRTVDQIPYSNELSLPLRLAQETNNTLYISISENLSTRGEAGIAALEISKITSYVYGVNTTGAFMEQGIEPTAPVITCANATPVTPVVTIERGNQTRIDVTDGTCIRLISDDLLGLIEAANALVYRLLGVIESE